MLEISQLARKRLTLDYALDVDDDGQEIFVGLTVAESRFMVICIQQAAHRLSLGEDFLYQQLKARHVKMRVQRKLRSSNFR
jgi:hypothetical protein